MKSTVLPSTIGFFFELAAVTGPAPEVSRFMALH